MPRKYKSGGKRSPSKNKFGRKQLPSEYEIARSTRTTLRKRVNDDVIVQVNHTERNTAATSSKKVLKPTPKSRKVDGRSTSGPLKRLKARKAYLASLGKAQSAKRHEENMSICVDDRDDLTIAVQAQQFHLPIAPGMLGSPSYVSLSVCVCACVCAWRYPFYHCSKLFLRYLSTWHSFFLSPYICGMMIW